MGPLVDRCDGDLEAYLAQAKNSTRPIERELLVWNLVLQVFVALEAIHEGPGTEPNWRPLVHGDIKQANIFYKDISSSPFPRIVVGDWGDAGYTFESVSGESFLQLKYPGIDLMEEECCLYDVRCLGN
ncbi:hypothetical protein BT63DRAFT_453153 [Microthyrium microscopicum]|uniref:Protein kinase domain-containing protein n=1 Tax=Microthyrium microscopicum TaxID=703497 RepID=A0A6A6UH66_9PEZI|nr:hypothetical protein BT63DRAFT_453153 [Microthyrium microscopicum]